MPWCPPVASNGGGKIQTQDFVIPSLIVFLCCIYYLKLQIKNGMKLFILSDIYWWLSVEYWRPPPKPYCRELGSDWEDEKMETVEY